MGRKRTGSVTQIRENFWQIRIKWLDRKTGKLRSFSDTIEGTKDEAETHREFCLNKLEGIEKGTFKKFPIKRKKVLEIEKRKPEMVAADTIFNIKKEDLILPESVSEQFSLNDWKLVFHNAKKNAKMRDKPFEITFKEFFKLVEKSGGCCELSGIPFSPKKVGNSFRRPFAPSLDRIDCSKGYCITNCRLVCIAVNVALNEWGAEVLYTVAANLIAHKQTAAKL
jgi:hypothetical protein